MSEATARKIRTGRIPRANALQALGLLAIALIAACDSGPKRIEPPRVKAGATHLSADEEALRVKIDTARDRVWVLGVEHASVYDRRTKRLIRRIALPQWMVAYFVCGPDIAFDRTGAAFISHNFEPKLWQIDPDSFELKEHTVRLVEKEQIDVGFGRLAFAGDGTLYGVASSGGSRWRIDVASASAQSVGLEAPVVDDCPLQ